MVMAQPSYKAQSMKITVLRLSSTCATVSVTRCWSKKQPNFLQKLPKKYPHQFNVKSSIFHNSPKFLVNIWATFARNFVPKNFEKSPNPFTLVVVHFIIKLCRGIKNEFGRLNERHQDVILRTYELRPAKGQLTSYFQIDALSRESDSV